MTPCGYWSYTQKETEGCSNSASVMEKFKYKLAVVKDEKKIQQQSADTDMFQVGAYAKDVSQLPV